MRTLLFSGTLALGLMLSPALRAQGSDDVRAEQQALKDKGFDPGPVDGVDGPKTRAALRQFQQKQNLQEDGRLGPQTRDELGLQAATPKTEMKESGTNLKTGYGEGGKDIGHGAASGAKNVVHGHPIEGAKDIGKGVGDGAVKIGEGTGHAAKNAAKGVKKVITGEKKDTTTTQP